MLLFLAFITSICSMKIIGKNIKYLRNLKDLTQEDLAKELKVTRAKIGSYEEERSDPSIDMLIILSEYFNLPIDVLVKHNLSASVGNSYIDIGQNRILFPVAVDGQNEDLVEIIPLKASAGYLSGYSDPEYIERLKSFSLPFLPTGKHRAFPIKGDSMLPMPDGSYVVAKFVDNIEKISNGRTYVVLTLNDGLVYKRLYNELKENKTIKFVSDNKTYQPFSLPPEEIMEIWEYSCSIRTEEYAPEDLKVDGIMRMFRDLQIELESLKRV